MMRTDVIKKIKKKYYHFIEPAAWYKSSPRVAIRPRKGQIFTWDYYMYMQVEASPALQATGIEHVTRRFRVVSRYAPVYNLKPDSLSRELKYGAIYSCIVCTPTACARHAHTPPIRAAEFIRRFNVNVGFVLMDSHES